MKQRCGLNAQRFSGSRMVIGIHGFFIVNPLKKDAGITLKDYLMRRDDGAHSQVEW